MLQFNSVFSGHSEPVGEGEEADEKSEEKSREKAIATEEADGEGGGQEEEKDEELGKVMKYRVMKKYSCQNASQE